MKIFLRYLKIDPSDLRVLTAASGAGWGPPAGSPLSVGDATNLRPGNIWVLVLGHRFNPSEYDREAVLRMGGDVFIYKDLFTFNWVDPAFPYVLRERAAGQEHQLLGHISCEGVLQGVTPGLAHVSCSFCRHQLWRAGAG